MVRMIVYVNAEGQVIGAVRSDPIRLESGTLQARVPDMAPEEALLGAPERPELTYREIEVSDDLLERESPEELHRELERKVRSEGAEG
jgi:hypothetical protein